MIKYLITGTGRCGTGYMSKIFTEAGIQCGHENIYRVEGIIYNENLEADSSWLAVPHLKEIKDFDITVIHIVRNPIKVFMYWIESSNYIYADLLKIK